jgi:antitoxin MazE
VSLSLGGEPSFDDFGDIDYSKGMIKISKRLPGFGTVDTVLKGNYCNYMKPFLECKLTAIGNSRGIRVPQAVIEKYGLEGGILVEALEDRLVLRPAKPMTSKLSWKETYKAMAKDETVESDWVGTDHDGLEEIPWEEGKAKDKKSRAK